MKLERLTLTNFMRVRDLDLDLSTHRIHLFAGSNEAGKSTIGDAIQFVLSGDSPRVGLKKHYKQLVSHGAKKGKVSLTFDGTLLTRDVSTGQSDDRMGDLPPAVQQALSIAMGAQRFVDLSADDRRKMLFALCQVKTDADGVLEQMSREPFSVTEPIRKKVSPLLKASIESAHTFAKSELSRLRTQWETVTGEKYGVVKGADWKPELKLPAPVPGSDKLIDDIQKQLDAVTTEGLNASKELGIVEAGLKRRATIEDALKQVAHLAHNLNVFQRDLEGHLKDRAELQTKVQTAEELLERAELAEKVLSCPGCDANVKLDNGELMFVDPEQQNFIIDATRRQELIGEVNESNRKLNTLKPIIEELEKNIETGSKQAQLVQEMQSEMDALPAGDKMDELEDALTAGRTKVAELRNALKVAQETVRVKQAGIEKRKRALELHLEIIEWVKAETALSPSGIPGALLAEALDEINGRMQASAALLGWSAPSINEDMDIIRHRQTEDGDEALLYGLLSESAQWRVSMIVADAISSMSGIKMLVIDRLDVLDPASRPAVFPWLVNLAEDEYDTILVMATLKEAPKSLPPAIRVHWLNQGVLATPGA